MKVTLKTLTATKLGNVTTVSVTYTLENDTSGLKEEKSWKMFYQGSGGQAFGFNGAILPNSSIDRSFTFGAVAPNGLLRLVYPADTLDESWDADDLIWDVTRLLLP